VFAGDDPSLGAFLDPLMQLDEAIGCPIEDEMVSAYLEAACGTVTLLLISSARVLSHPAA